MGVKTHVFNGRRYNINIYPNGLDGVCDQYKITNEDREIAIFTDPATKNGLITIIHEALHASNWKASEKSVDRTSTEIGSLLWRLGFRLNQK